MTELLENSDNTNESAVVSESPANEATISLAAVQALADALQKIEAYTPTVWVDNESPDIDAAHLNKAEQAIMRVTTAMNSAVDVIKDLQSQVNTTNNNLSNISNRFYVQSSETDFNRLTKSGYYFGKFIQNTPDGTTDSNWIVEVQAFDNNPNYVFQRVTRASDKAIFTRIQNNGTWSDWEVLARKSDLPGYSIYVAGDGGTQNFNIGNNGFLFIPYTSTTFGIYYIGRNSAKLILGTEDSDFKVSVSESTCTLQNNKGWNIFCVFIAG